MKVDLKDKNILVTGASRGIGRAIAQQLAESGANVGIHYSKSDNEAEKLEKTLVHSKKFKADLTHDHQVLKLMEDFIAHFGQLDVLVNNAGIAVSINPSHEDNKWMEAWRNTQDVNLNALALLCKKAIEHFITRDGGRIINISSRAAFKGDTAEYFAYAASKGGVVTLTRSIAMAYGKQGITAFNIAPGFTRTDMAQALHFSPAGWQTMQQDAPLILMREVTFINFNLYPNILNLIKSIIRNLNSKI